MTATLFAASLASLSAAQQVGIYLVAAFFGFFVPLRARLAVLSVLAGYVALVLAGVAPDPLGVEAVIAGWLP